MTLKDKLRKIGIGVGLAGVLAVNSCKYGGDNRMTREPNWNLLIGMGVRSHGVNNDNPAAVEVGDSLISAGVASEARSDVRQEVHLHSNENNSNQIQRKNQFFMFNHFKGDPRGNGDGTYNFEELVGYGTNAFRSNEQCRLGYQIFNRMGDTLAIKIASHEEGQYVEYTEKILRKNYGNWRVLLRDKKIKPGRFIASFRIGEETLGAVEFYVLAD